MMLNEHHKTVRDAFDASSPPPMMTVSSIANGSRRRRLVAKSEREPEVEMNSKLQPVVLHLPHDSTVIPPEYRDQFMLSIEQLAAELVTMTDSHTAAIFSGITSDRLTVRCPVSRLLVDVERFADDAQEIMVARGMGVVYTQTSAGQRLRRTLRPGERDSLLERFYEPHHRRLTQAVSAALQESGTVLLLDAHSFPSRPLTYELVQDRARPDICIGTDNFHTPTAVADTFMAAFADAGFSVALNRPFAGAIVPMEFYRTNPAVHSVMVEVNRALYMNEKTGERLPCFDEVAVRVRACCVRGSTPGRKPALPRC